MRIWKDKKPKKYLTRRYAGTLITLFGEEMKDINKLGRTAWVTYLIAATPVALICVGMTLLWIQSFFFEDIGPLEEPPAPPLQKIVFLISMISLPITWVLSITIAHRFNGAMLRTIPFLANILPTAGLVWFAFILSRDEGGEFFWMTAYTGFLIAALAIGMVAAIVSTHQNTNTEQDGSSNGE